VMADTDASSTTPINIPLERSLYVGNMLRGILYGMEVVTFLAAVYCISHRPSGYRKSQKFYVIYGGVLLSLTTIEVALDALWGQYMWIDHRNYPGGPLGFYLASEVAWYTAMAFGAGVMANILGDGLLVYRCYIIWDSRWQIMVVPAMIYLASSVTSILTVVESAIPGTSMLKGKPIKLAVPWVSLSVSLNIIVTSMICVRLMWMRARLREVFAPEMASMYTSVATMLVESAAPFSILGIGLVVTAAQKGPLVFAFGYVWSIFCSFSPQMIILRVAMGRGFLKETVNELHTTLVFARSTVVHGQSQAVCVTIRNTEDPISGSGLTTDSSDMSVSKPMSGTVVTSLV